MLYHRILGIYHEYNNNIGEDSSENRLIIMGRLRVLKVYRLRSYLMNGKKSTLRSAILKHATCICRCDHSFDIVGTKNWLKYALV